MSAQRAVIYDASAKIGMTLTTARIPLASKGQVLVKVKAISINPVDYKLPTIPLVGASFAGKIAGNDFSALVAEFFGLGVDYSAGLGEGVTSFQVGDKVFGAVGGAFCEYLTVDASKIAKMPSSADFGQAASLPVVAVTSLQALRDHGHLKQGDKVLILGASGGCGGTGVQIAKCIGAEVTAVCSGKNSDLVKKLGADRIIDYTTQTVSEALAGEIGTFDMIYDTVSSSDPADKQYESETRPLLKKGGMYVGINGAAFDMIRYFISKAIHLNLQRSYFTVFMADLNCKDLRDIAEMVDDQKLSPVIDTKFDLSPETLEAGFSRLKSRRTVGKIVFKVDEQE